MNWKSAGPWLWRHLRRPLVLTCVYAGLWFLLWLDFRFFFWFAPVFYTDLFSLAVSVWFY